MSKNRFKKIVLTQKFAKYFDQDLHTDAALFRLTIKKSFHINYFIFLQDNRASGDIPQTICDNTIIYFTSVGSEKDNPRDSSPHSLLPAELHTDSICNNF